MFNYLLICCSNIKKSFLSSSLHKGKVVKSNTSLGLIDLSNISFESITNFIHTPTKENKLLVDTLFSLKGFSDRLFTEYLFCKKALLLRNPSEVKLELSSEMRASYSYLINNKNLNEKGKAALEIKLLESLLETYSLNVNAYTSHQSSYQSLGAMLSYISSIIDSGYIFKSKITEFRSLLWIFSNSLVTENLSAKRLHICLERFSNLSIMAKKVIFKNLIKKKQETIILNLFNRGIDLNWMIDFDGHGRQEVCSLKILENLKLSNVLFSNLDWNMLVKNSTGDNILHIICGSSILDGNLAKIKTKVSYLSLTDRYNFLNEKNEKGLTPLNQAILLRDEEMIDFLIESGVKKWGDESSNPLDFLELCISGKNKCLLPESLRYSTQDNEFWFNLLKVWESEKLFIELDKKFNKKALKERVVKI